MNQHATVEAGKDLQILSHYIAANAYDVRRIEKQKVSLLQTQEDVQIDTLNRGSDQPNTITQRFFWKPVRMRVNRQQFSTDAVHLQVLVHGSCHDPAAVSAADFDDPLGLEVPHHAVRDLGIHRFKESIAPRVARAADWARG